MKVNNQLTCKNIVDQKSKQTAVNCKQSFQKVNKQLTKGKQIADKKLNI